MLFSCQVCILYIYLHICIWIHIHIWLCIYIKYMCMHVCSVSSVMSNSFQAHGLFFPRFFSIIGDYKILSIVLCATQKVLIVYLFYIVVVQLMSHVRLCNLMDCSLPGSSVQGISQARILEQGAISYARGSSWPTDWTHVSYIGRWILYR